MRGPFSTSSAEAQLREIFALPSHTVPKWVAHDKLVFLDDQTGVPQVYSLELETGVVTQLTHGRERVQSLLASPGSARVVFGMDSGGDERQQLWSLELGSGKARRLTVADGVLNEPGQLSADGNTLVYRNNERDVGAFDVIVQDLRETDADARRVFESTGQVMPLDVTDDGSRILVKRLLTNLDADLLLLDLESEDVQLLNERTDESWILDARFSSDGTDVFSLTNEGSDFVRLERVSIDSGDRQTVVDSDWDVEQFALSGSSGVIAYVLNRDGYSELWLARSDGTESIRARGLEGGVIESLSWSPDGERLAVSWTGPTWPARIHLVDRDGSSQRVAAAGVSSDKNETFRRPTTIRFPAFDERHIPAFWYRPSSAPPWPVVVDVHGGPESQRRPGFSPLTQFLLAQGFAVLAPNVRGSTGYGKTYSHLDDRDLRMDSVADLHAAYRWLSTVDEVRADGIVVMGQSYGGFMTLAALTEYPDDWAAGVDVVGIANFVTFLERTGAWRRAHRSAEYGDLERDRATLERISPIAKMDRIRVPLFVIHGRNDPRVPLHEAEQIVASLRAIDRDVELLVFDDEGHGLSKRPNRVRGYGAVAAFLERVNNERS